MQNKVKIDVPSMQMPFGNYTASLISGIWYYDPIQKSENALVKKESAKYKDPAQFKIMEQYEQVAKDNYRKRIKKLKIK